MGRGGDSLVGLTCHSAMTKHSVIDVEWVKFQNAAQSPVILVLQKFRLWYNAIEGQMQIV
jgi:hypothetical protein